MAWAIARGSKPVENRTWQTRYRGLLAIHAALGMDRRDLAASARLAELVDVPAQTIATMPMTRGAVVAVARLADICSASLLRSRVVCGCGPWAMPGHRHLILVDVVALAGPVPCKGALGLWRLPDDVEAAVLAQLKQSAVGDCARCHRLNRPVFGPTAEWGRVPSPLCSPCWSTYADVRAAGRFVDFNDAFDNASGEQLETAIGDGGKLALRAEHFTEENTRG
jgi:hypothetical protein